MSYCGSVGKVQGCEANIRWESAVSHILYRAIYRKRAAQSCAHICWTCSVHHWIIFWCSHVCTKNRDVNFSSGFQADAFIWLICVVSGWVNPEHSLPHFGCITIHSTTTSCATPRLRTSIWVMSGYAKQSCGVPCLGWSPLYYDFHGGPGWIQRSTSLNAPFHAWFENTKVYCWELGYRHVSSTRGFSRSRCGQYLKAVIISNRCLSFQVQDCQTGVCHLTRGC